ncbi:MAG: RNA polymerase sigma factor RpoH [Rickettsiaceae bacterium]|nr:RNA polymerase sigma factor RpoH [Rickettsiaceae bacterium]MDP4832712.1 RNA polymerase sigma factor RpoH [Rickettsiaceae bacterium]MDP5020403.1 RNA polymerase sigma factor RpoH [Rickettsiaceae bacterium]MDP5083104.1 RNA polymerase sigma factor RpoH [Rickettsiaceae bacterium]
MSNMIKLPAITTDSGFSKYLREINSIPSLSQEDEFLLAKAYLEEHDLDAAHKLVTSHLKLVVKIAMKYKNYGLPVAELVSEGNIGLMQAVKKYDPELGYRLSTYAMWWIKAAIQEYVLKSWSLVKIGTTSAQKKLFFSLRKIKNKLSNHYARSISANDYQEIADELGVSVKEVSEMDQRLAGPDMSLNSTIDQHDDDSSELIELLQETKASQEDTLSKNQLLSNQKQILSDAMRVLTEREVRILTARKLNTSPSTLDTLSGQYNISKERVRQIENKAFEKVQNYVLAKITNDGQMKLVDC